MGLSIEAFTTQLADLLEQYQVDDDLAAYKIALAALYAQYDSVGTLSANVTALLTIKGNLLSAYQAGVGIKGTVALVSDLPPTPSEGDGWIVSRTGHLYVRLAGQWVDLGSFAPAVWTVVTGDMTAVSGQKLIADTTAASFTITLPSDGGAIQIRDHDSSFGVNPLTVDGNGRTFGEDSTIDLDLAGFIFDFEATTTTWSYGLSYRYGGV